MRGLLIAITFIFLLPIVTLAQSAISGSLAYSNKKTTVSSVIKAREDSIKAEEEKDWNKHLIINSDSRIDTLIEIHKEENSRKRGTEGYRVQIFQGSKEEADKVDARFLSIHDNIEAAVKFNEPYATVELGNFRMKSEAVKLKQQIKSEYPSAYIVERIIDFPKLLEVEASK